MSDGLCSIAAITVAEAAAASGHQIKKKYLTEIHGVQFDVKK
jgi:hypothetical protein